MTKSFSRFVANKYTLFVTSLVSALSAFMFYSCRANYVFIDSYVFNGLSYLLLSLMLINTILQFLLFVATSYNVSVRQKVVSESKAFRVLSVICFIITAVFLIGVSVNIGIAGEETIPVIMKMAAKGFPLFLACTAVILLISVFPLVKNKKIKTVVVTVLIAGVVGVSLWTLAPVCVYQITCDPMVIDSGEDYYSVVFATNDEGTGYIKYTYNGEQITVYDEMTGRIKSDSKIHTVKVPKEHLEGNTYKVGSKRVIEAYSYGSNTGKEVESKEYNFTVPKGENQTWLSVSDWHTMMDKAYKAISYAGDYNGVMILGDGGPGYMFEDEVRENIVEFCGNVCKGTKPIVFVRGNHETRGEYAAEIPDYLGMDNFYYTTQYGGYRFVVLDSGEDKEDSHPEYGGMVNYGEYRKKMTEWMQTIGTSDKKTVVLCHSYEICIEPELREKAYQAIKNAGARQIISGHTHTNKMFEEKGLNVYLDGGYKNGVYIVSKLTFDGDTLRMQAWNNKGQQVFDDTSTL